MSIQRNISGKCNQAYKSLAGASAEFLSFRLFSVAQSQKRSLANAYTHNHHILAKFDCKTPSFSEEKRWTHEELRQHRRFTKKQVHAKKRCGFIGSNGRRQNMATTSGTAGRRRMPGDSLSGTLNLRVPFTLGDRCDAHVFACYRRRYRPT